MKQIFVCIFLFLMVAHSDGFSQSFFDSIARDHLEVFTQSFSEKNYERCLQVLDQWEEQQDDTHIGTILGLRSSVFLARGEFEKSFNMMHKSLCFLEDLGLSESDLAFIQELYCSESFQTELSEELSENLMSFGNSMTPFLLCKNKRKQPRGVRLKFWGGVAGIVAGCLTMPFNPAAGLILIGGGSKYVFDATTESLDNQDDWERELDDRQKIGSDLETQKTSFVIPQRLVFQPCLLSF